MPCKKMDTADWPLFRNDCGDSCSSWSIYNNFKAKKPELCVWRFVLFMMFVRGIALFEH